MYNTWRMNTAHATKAAGVDPLLGKGTPLHFYEAQTWGPAAVDQLTPAGGWQDPVIGSSPAEVAEAA